MEYDLIIRGGTVIDGSGSEPIKADIAVNAGRIARIGNLGDASASKTLDATGKMVTPGFVDLHTHLDAQIGWDPMMSSSSYHGVTTAMIGNCGVTFAPCSPKNRRYLAELMESVEDIAADAIMDGLPWDWTSYGEYLDSVQSLKPVLNVVGLAGHSAIRYEAMGDRSMDEGAQPDDKELEHISQMVKEAKRKRSNPAEVPYQNDGGEMSLLTHPGTAMHQKMRATSKPGTDEWFKTWRTLSYLTKGRKNHYMLPVKEQLEKLLIKYGIIKEAPEDEAKLDKKNLLGLRQDILDKLEALPQTKDSRRTLEKIRELLQATDATDNLRAYAERITDLGAQDTDVAGAVEQLTKLIGAVVQMTSVKDKNLFFKLWEGDRLVKVDKLMKGGEVMNLSGLFSYYGRSKAVTYVVNSLSKDAGYGLGKGEFLLAVLSRRIQKAPGKGDLLIDGKSIEVKATDGGSPRFADQEVRVAQGYEQTRDQLFDLYKEEIAQTGGAGKTGLNLEKWIAVGQQTTVDKPTFAKNTAALLNKIFPEMDNTALSTAIAAGQLGKAKSLYANASFTRYMNIKQDEAVLYINLSKKDPTYVMFRTVEDLANMGLYLHAETIYILGMSGNRDVYPQMSVKASQ